MADYALKNIAANDSKIFTIQADAFALPFKDNSFEFIGEDNLIKYLQQYITEKEKIPHDAPTEVVTSILSPKMKILFQYLMKECFRILKKDGVIICVEGPLALSLENLELIIDDIDFSSLVKKCILKLINLEQISAEPILTIEQTRLKRKKALFS